MWFTGSNLRSELRQNSQAFNNQRKCFHLAVRVGEGLHPLPLHSYITFRLSGEYCVLYHCAQRLAMTFVEGEKITFSTSRDPVYSHCSFYAIVCVRGCVRACAHRHTHARKHSGAYWDEETRLQHQYTGEWLPHSAHLVRVLTGWTTDVGGPTALALKHCCQASQRANTMSRKLSLRGDCSKRALGVGVGWGGERGGVYRGHCQGSM